MSKQEKWMYQNLSKLKRGIMIGVGAAFRYYIGELRVPPIIIQNIGLQWFSRLLQQPKTVAKSQILRFPHFRDVEEEFRHEADHEMPIVADVHTDVNTGSVLEEGIGEAMLLYAVAPVDGKPIVCHGVVYSQYEFKQPMSNRLTDEAWREMVRKRKTPAMPSWVQAYAPVKR